MSTKKKKSPPKSLSTLVASYPAYETVLRDEVAARVLGAIVSSPEPWIDLGSPNPRGDAITMAMKFANTFMDQRRNL